MATTEDCKVISRTSSSGRFVLGVSVKSSPVSAGSRMLFAEWRCLFRHLVPSHSSPMADIRRPSAGMSTLSLGSAAGTAACLLALDRGMGPRAVGSRAAPILPKVLKILSVPKCHLD